MNYKTHFAGGIGSGLVAFEYAQKILVHNSSTSVAIVGMAFIIGAGIGSLFPDIDKANSYIGRRAKIISTINEIAFGHRGLFHYPIFYVALIPILLWAIQTFAKVIIIQPAEIITLGFGVGVFSHLFLDSFNEGGISWLFPFTKKRFHFASIKVNSFSEKIVTIILSVLDVAYITTLISVALK